MGQKKPKELIAPIPDSKTRRTQRMHTQRTNTDSDLPEKYTPLYPSLEGNEANKLFNQVDYKEIIQEVETKNKTQDIQLKDSDQNRDNRDGSDMKIHQTIVSEDIQKSAIKPNLIEEDLSNPKTTPSIVVESNVQQVKKDAHQGGVKEGQSVFEQDIIQEKNLLDKKVPTENQESNDKKLAPDAIEEF